MIQIRHKKQSQRQQIRRSYLDSHFKQLRRRYFNFGQQCGSNSGKYQSQDFQIIQYLMNESLKFNQIPKKIRNENLLDKLNELAQTAITCSNLMQIKYLLTIMSNSFQDQLNLQQKESIFRISIQLFESLKISQINFSNEYDKKYFANLTQIIPIQVLAHYIRSANFISQYLQEQDQIRIQKQIYPAFLSVLFYGLMNPLTIVSFEDFENDTQQFLLNSFDLKEQIYDQGNRMKVKRLYNFFIGLCVNHNLYLQEHYSFNKCFSKIEYRLYWVYQKLSQYYKEIESFFNRKQLFSILRRGFWYQIDRKQNKKMKIIYSILHTLIDNNIFMKQIQQMMICQHDGKQRYGINKLLKNLDQVDRQIYKQVQYLCGMMISNYENSYFSEIVNIYNRDIICKCVGILNNFELQYLRQGINRTLLSNILQIIQVLIQRGNSNSSKNEQNENLRQMQLLYGIDRLQVIKQWIQQIDSDQGYQFLQIINNIQWIQNQSINLSINLQ